MTSEGRAAVFDQVNGPLRLDTFPVPAPAAGEVIVDVALCTLCGSDLHTYFGRRNTPMPTILGHEVIGRVAALPDNAPVCDLLGDPLNVGDRITWSIAASCGDCFFCTHGLPQKCSHLFKYGHERLRPEHAFSGGLAAVCHLARGTAIVRLPDALSDEVACPANCATATVMAAFRTAGLQAGEVVLLHGAGMLGLTACAAARARAAQAVIVCEPDTTRRELARRFGATHVVAPHDAPLRDLLADLTAGRGADVAIDLSGVSAAVAQQLAQLRIGGRCVLLGTTRPAAPLTINPEQVTRRLWHIAGLHNYVPADLATAVQFLTEHGATYPFAELVTETFPLDEATAAFNYAEESRALRIAVRP